MTEEKNGNGKKDEPGPEFEKFQRLLRQIVSVPKEKVDERRAEYNSEKDRKKQTG